MLAELRSYGDPCGIARALDAVGERWALLVVRELSLGPKRFTDLKVGLPQASPNVLSQRLRELMASGVVRRTAAGAAAYELTPWGSALHPLLLALGRWGAASPAPPRGDLGIDALLLALEATYRASPKLPETPVAIVVELSGVPFTVTLAAGGMTTTRGAGRSPRAVVQGEPATLRAVVFGDIRREDSDLAIEGDRAVASAFLRSFVRPARA